jgi:hypothetical protein
MCGHTHCSLEFQARVDDLNPLQAVSGRTSICISPTVLGCARSSECSASAGGLRSAYPIRQVTSIPATSKGEGGMTKQNSFYKVTFCKLPCYMCLVLATWKCGQSVIFITLLNLPCFMSPVLSTCKSVDNNHHVADKDKSVCKAVCIGQPGAQGSA